MKIDGDRRWRFCGVGGLWWCTTYIGPSVSQGLELAGSFQFGREDNMDLQLFWAGAGYWEVLGVGTVLIMERNNDY